MGLSRIDQLNAQGVATKVQSAQIRPLAKVDLWRTLVEVLGSGTRSLLSATTQSLIIYGRLSISAIVAVLAIGFPFHANAESFSVGDKFRDCDECPEMVVVPAGSFMMGSPKWEDGRQDYEGPMHQVTIAEPFAVGVYEVTYSEWDACGYDGGCSHRPEDWDGKRGYLPVQNVSWEDANKYVDWLSQFTGERYRLLSESEWEYVARAGTTTPYHFGHTISKGQANYNNEWGLFDVGSFPPNDFGLHDVHGNVWEWVEDCWNSGGYIRNYESAPSDGSAWIEGLDCRLRVLRGGSWGNFIPQELRSANRVRLETGIRDVRAGFRVARTLAPIMEGVPLREAIGERLKQLFPDGKFQDCSECPEMVVVPAGSFRMGSPAAESFSEGPLRRVTIPEPFAVSRYEVTRSQYAAFAESTEHTSVGTCQIFDDWWRKSVSHSWRNPGFVQSEQDPAVCVSWNDAKEYVEWLSRKTGEHYRLLSESEWEYVARAGTTGPFHFGWTISTDQANYNGNYTYGEGRKGVYRERTVPVGNFPSNGFGLHDIHGNVREWVEDCWRESYNGAPSDGNAWISGGECGVRVLRGGSWFNKPWDLRSARRSSNKTETRTSLNGFRVARMLTP